MKDAEYLAKQIGQLVDHWPERVEYMIDVQTHTPGCRALHALAAPGSKKHWACLCPRRREARAKTATQQPLLVQLRLLAQPPIGADPAGAGIGVAPGSKPPGSLQAADMLTDIRRDTRTCRLDLAGQPRALAARLAVELRELVSLAAQLPEDDQRAADAIWYVRRMVRRARVLLGYDAPMRQLANTICNHCGGALMVSADADSDVRCIGTPEASSCGTIYRRWQWVDLLDQQITDLPVA